MKDLAYKWRKLFASINHNEGNITLKPIVAQELIDNLEQYNEKQNRHINDLMQIQTEYIKDLIPDDSEYSLEEYLDITKSDKMTAYVNNAENYNFELGKYIAYKELLIK